MRLKPQFFRSFPGSGVSAGKAVVRLLAIILAALLAGMATAQECVDWDAAPMPDPRYVSIQNGTVYDQRTGLMWKQCPEGAAGIGCAAGEPQTFKLEDAKRRAREWRFAGYADWRLPTRTNCAPCCCDAAMVSASMASPFHVHPRAASGPRTRRPIIRTAPGRSTFVVDIWAMAPNAMPSMPVWCAMPKPAHRRAPQPVCPTASGASNPRWPQTGAGERRRSGAPLTQPDPARRVQHLAIEIGAPIRVEPQPPLGEPAHHGRIDDVFLFQHPCRQRAAVVSR
jgi:hypothetical protein